jgi:hypothetical protein
MVAMNVWPTDGADGSVANEARWRKMARHFTATGVLVGVGNGLAPSLAMPNLTVKDGAAWVDGAFCELLGTQVLTATANGIAVVRFDPAANTAELLWRDGVTVPAQSPTGTYELLIASTSASVLRDERLLAPNSPAGIQVSQATWTLCTPSVSVRVTWGAAYKKREVGRWLPADSTNVVCPQPGLYRLTLQVSFASLAGGVQRAAEILLNDAIVPDPFTITETRVPVNGAATWLNVGSELRLVAGDKVGARLYQDASGSLSATQCCLTATRIGDS